MNVKWVARMVVLSGWLALSGDAQGAPTKLNVSLVLNGDVASTSLQFSPDGLAVLYLADQEVDGVFEAFMVSSSGGVPRKVNDALIAGGDVVGAQFSPDGESLVYRANQELTSSVELYSAPRDGSSLPVKLNGPLPMQGQVGTLQFLADSSRVIYSADQAAASVFELFSVPLAGGIAVRLNGGLVNGGDAFLVGAERTGELVIYVADQDVDQVMELYAATADGEMWWKLNQPLTAGGDVDLKGVRTAADSSRVIYLADANVDQAFELFSVASTSGEAVRLNSPLVNGGDVLANPIRLSPAVDRVLYMADQDLDERFEIYSVPIAGGDVVKLNGQLVLNGDVRENSLAFSPEGSRVLYMADQEADEVLELFMVDSAGGESLKLNGSLVNGGDVSTALFSADGSRVVYRADQEIDEVFELYSVGSDGQSPAKLNLPLVLNGDVMSFSITPDGSRVVYLADQEFDQVFELYTVPTAGGVVEKLSGPLASGGDVTDWWISPDSRRVVYRADQDADEVFEIYSVLLSASTIDGDFNGDGLVDAADYTKWRDGLGTIYTVDDYTLWEENFLGGGGSAGVVASSSSIAVPEPAGWVVWSGAIAGLIRRGRRRERYRETLHRQSSQSLSSSLAGTYCSVT